MATSTLKGKDNIYRINTYTIDPKLDNILGKGAYGIVYRAINNEDKTVGAKTIDGKTHPRILTQDVNKLLQLTHENVDTVQGGISSKVD